jgi:hypothetical protein
MGWKNEGQKERMDDTVRGHREGNEDGPGDVGDSRDGSSCLCQAL